MLVKKSCIKLPEYMNKNHYPSNYKRGQIDAALSLFLYSSFKDVAIRHCKEKLPPHQTLYYKTFFQIAQYTSVSNALHFKIAIGRIKFQLCINSSVNNI